MANAKKCDRCREFYEERDPNPFEILAQAFKPLIRTEVLANKMEMILDFCPRCSRSLRQWLEQTEEVTEDGK